MSEQPPTWITVDTSSAPRAPRALDLILLPAPWEHGRDVLCDERCVCPVHGTPLFFWPAGEDHACQDVDCRYGHGMKKAEPERPASDEEKNA